MNYKRHKFGPETESTIPTLFGFEDLRPQTIKAGGLTTTEPAGASGKTHHLGFDSASNRLASEASGS